MSARSSASSARNTEWCSVPASVRDGRRMPAVSRNLRGPSSVSSSVSMASRVVPGMSWTMERSSPMMRLNSVDLPALGLPTRATCGTPAWSVPAGRVSRRCRLGWRSRRGRRASSRADGGVLNLNGRPGSALIGAHRPEDHLVQQVAGAPAVCGAHRPRVAQAETDEIPNRRLPGLVVDLVRYEHDGGARPPHDSGRRQVLRRSRRW